MKFRRFTAIFIIISLFSALPVLSQMKPRSKRATERDLKINFRVKWDGKVIPGIKKVSGLKRKTEVITHRSGVESSIY
jgi:hypothetical protein